MDSIGWLKIKVQEKSLIVRLYLDNSKDSSIFCQFFYEHDSRVAYEIQFTYQFLHRYNDKLFNVPNLYCANKTISSVELKPLVRFGIRKFVEHISKEDKTMIIRLTSDDDVGVLESYNVKECIHFNKNYCSVSSKDDEIKGLTTSVACQNCPFPEYFEKCAALINGETKGINLLGKINRQYLNPVCNLNNQIEDVLKCRYRIKRCFIAPEIGDIKITQKTKTLFISCRCREFETERLVLKRNLEKQFSLKVLLIPESDESFPSKTEVRQVSLKSASESDIYLLLIGKEFAEIIEEEFNAALKSLESKSDKEILVYIKRLSQRDSDTEKFIENVKNKVIIRDFENIDDLESRINVRLQYYKK